MIHTHDKNLAILNDFHTQAKKKKKKKLKKNIKPNNKSHKDVQMNECNYVTSSFQCKKIHDIPYYTTIN